EGLTTRRGCSMGETLTHKLIRSHLAEGATHPGEEIAIRMDQALLQDATGTLAWLEFEQMGQNSVAIRQATQYVDHNILQTGYENADDHRFLGSVCQRYGALFSGPGNGISHWAHMERFDMPGETMLGCDSHTPHAGACGMLAIGAGGFEVASAMAGEPYRLTMPEVVNVKLTGAFKPWVSAKDVILELLHRFDVKWAKNKVLEYTGPALRELTVPPRGTTANMGTELGATASLFPADGRTKQSLTAQPRGQEFKPLAAAADERPVSPDVQPQLRGTKWDRGRPRLSVQPRDRRSHRGARRDHGSEGAGQVPECQRACEVSGRHVGLRVASKGPRLRPDHPRAEHRATPGRGT